MSPKNHTPMTKGENRMSEKKKDNMNKGGVFPKPPVPSASWGMNEERVQNIKSTMKSAWEQRKDRKKETADNRRQQWQQFFDYNLKMQETFINSLPDDVSALPPFLQRLPMSPKAFMERVKEFEIMANEHFMEQADSINDFFSKGKEQLTDLVSAAMEKKEKEKED